MWSKYLAFATMAVLVASCASTPPAIDRVQKVPEYIVIPDEILARCPIAPLLTQEQRDALSTELEYNEEYVIPLFEAWEECHKVVKNVKELNKNAKQLNAANAEIEGTDE